jgi:hypothetical protein
MASYIRGNSIGRHIQSLGKPYTIALFIFTVAIVFSTLATIPTVEASAYPNSSFPDTWTAIEHAYASLSDASSAGGNVTQSTANQLSLAISKALSAESLHSLDHAQAQTLATEARDIALIVEQGMLSVKEEGIRQGQMALYSLVVFVAACLISALLVYRFGPNWVRGGWLRVRSNQMVKMLPKGMAETHVKANEKAGRKTKPGKNMAGNGNNNKEEDEKEGTPLTLETISMVVTIILVVIAGIAISQYYLSGLTGETFSELGILGPNMILGDYPREVVAGDNVHLFAYVGNHLGEPAWFSVLVKVGDNSTSVDPLQAPAIKRIDVVLCNDQNWTSVVDFTLTQAGINRRIVFELWSLNSTTNSMEYTQRWGQIWVNVTLPP